MPVESTAGNIADINLVNWPPPISKNIITHRRLYMREYKQYYPNSECCHREFSGVTQIMPNEGWGQ